MCIVDELLENKIEIFESGVARRVSVFEAIALQLWIKATSGDRRALAVLLSYHEYFSADDDAGFEIEYLDNEYTRRLRGLQRAPNVENKNE